MSKPAQIVGFGLDDASHEHTRAVFQAHSETPLTREDCRDIHRNLVGAFQVLLRIKRRLLAEEQQRAVGLVAGARSPNPEVSIA